MNFLLTSGSIGLLYQKNGSISRTDKDMKNKYKETSKGGLAVHYVEC